MLHHTKHSLGISKLDFIFPSEEDLRFLTIQAAIVFKEHNSGLLINAGQTTGDLS